MTIEYVLLLAIASIVLLPALLSAPKTGFTNGGLKLGARVETQLATGNGFQPYSGTGANGGDNGKVPWDRRE